MTRRSTKRPREMWHRDMVLSTGEVVDLEWQPLGRIEIGNETLVDAPSGVVRINCVLTSGEAWEIRRRLREDDPFFDVGVPK